MWEGEKGKDEYEERLEKELEEARVNKGGEAELGISTCRGAIVAPHAVGARPSGLTMNDSKSHEFGHVTCAIWETSRRGEKVGNVR